jgi:multisubunit Na+/H+ antiporter MnhB subunit
VLGGSRYSAVQEFMDAFWQGAVGGAGVILIILALRRDDVVRPIFLVAGIALAVFGFGGQFFGLKL